MARVDIPFDSRFWALERCCTCAVEFLVPMALYQAARADERHKFWCPNGHGQSYTESEVTRLKRERDLAIQDKARIEDEKRDAEKRAEAAERATQRLRKRIGKGVCPCCNRTFENVARHMATKHPDIAVLRMKDHSARSS